jgi:hypothetical protein
MERALLKIAGPHFIDPLSLKRELRISLSWILLNRRHQGRFRAMTACGSSVSI